MSGKQLLFTYINFLFCSSLTGCIMREEEVFQLNWISIWSQLKAVGNASRRLWGTVWCLLFLCQGNGNWLFLSEQLISISLLQNCLLSVLQERQRCSWVGGGALPPAAPAEKQSAALPSRPAFSIFCSAHRLSSLGPYPSTGGRGVDAQCLLGPDSRLPEGRGPVLQERESRLKEPEFCSIKPHIISARWIYCFVAFD